jgi:hypothetical protein
MAVTVFNQEITNAGGTFTFDPQGWGGGNAIIYLYCGSGTVLAANVSVQFSSLQNIGSLIQVVQYFGVNNMDLNGNTFQINGTAYDQWAYDIPFIIAINREDTAVTTEHVLFDLYYGGLSGTALLDASLTLAKFPALTRGYIWRGDSTGRPALFDARTNAQILIGDGTDLVSVPVTGDIAITNAGVTSIAAGAIVNADINASAAIAVSKLAALTASQVVTTTAGGVLTTAATLSATLGGTGLDNSAATGFPIWTAGTQAVGAISEVITLMVSFEAAGGTQASVGDFKIKMPYAGTVTEIYAYATKAIAATDNGTIVPKNNGGTTMTDGTVTFTASDARGTAYTTTPSANNTFAAGDLLTFTTAKATAGGIVQLSITVTRTS